MADSDILNQSEIDALLASLTGGSISSPEPAQEQQPQYRQSDAMMAPQVIAPAPIYQEEEKKGYKLYNFRRPDKFSKDHLRALQDIHKEFSRQFGLILTAYLRLHVDIEVVSVDQLTYDEFMRSMPNPITLCVLELNPLPGDVLMALSHEVATSLVDRMLGGTGFSEMKPRELTDIEENLIKRIFQKATKSLEDSWKSVFPVQGEVKEVESNYTLIQIASPGEIVALVTLEIQVANKFSGLLSLCFPYPVLETVISQLTSQHIFQAKGIISSAEDKNKILSKISNTSVDVSVLLGSSQISVHELLDLKLGDVLKLENHVNDNLVVKVNGIPKFTGRPGTKKGRLAVNITNVISNLNE